LRSFQWIEIIQNLPRKDFTIVLKQPVLPVIRFHDLRHSAASQMLNHGIPVLVVSRILGHANPSITLNTYGHLYTESVGVAAKLMDELVTPLRVEFSPVEKAVLPPGREIS
jgi:integrase